KDQYDIDKGLQKKRYWYYAILAALGFISKTDRGKQMPEDYDGMSEQEFADNLKKNAETEIPKKLLVDIPLYELSFLDRMISGVFNNKTEESFSDRRDKRLFHKFNTLNLDEKKAKYAELERRIKEFGLQ